MTKTIYKRAAGAIFSSKKAQAVGEYLENLTKIKKNKLTAKEVVIVARSEDCCLHEYFEWDDHKAGALYRVEQAVDLLNHLRVAVKNESGEEILVKAYFNIEEKTKEGKESYYAPVNVVAKSEFMREQVIKRALDEIIAWKERYKTYKELGEIFHAIEKTQKKLKF